MEGGLLSTPWAVPQGVPQEQVAQGGALEHTPSARLLVLYLLLPKQYLNRRFLLLAASLSPSDGVNQAAATGCRDVPPQDADQGKGTGAAPHGMEAKAHGESPTATHRHCGQYPRAEHSKAAPVPRGPAAQHMPVPAQGRTTPPQPPAPCIVHRGHGSAWEAVVLRLLLFLTHP